jgi:3-oxoadipate enol-lactonase/4-carboxymuconolactone decarboxylase
MLHTTPAHGYAASCSAIRDMDQRESIRAVTNPVLVVVGSRDPATPPEMGRHIANAIPGARIVTLEAAHLSNIEQADAFNQAVIDFLTAREVGPAPRVPPRHAAGRKPPRKPVASGEVWTRPGLDRRMRSVGVLSTTIALGAWDEFRLHVRAAINNGLTQDEIKEVIIQSAIYSGVPKANHAFKEAGDVLKDIEAEKR